MKKIGQIAIAAVVTVTVFSACKQNHTCACNVSVEAFTEGDSTGMITVEAQDTTFTYAYEGVSKKDADNQCEGAGESLNTTYKMLFEDHVTVNCDLN